MDSQPLPILEQHQAHPRSFRSHRYVYPVLSRRSKGISVGINLNPDKICNFDCIYCQVDRREDSDLRFVATDQLKEELETTLDWIASGRLFEDEAFASVPEPLRRLNDIAFSGDGEPTTFRNIDEIVSTVAGIKRRRGLDEVRMVLITNASMFHRPVVARAIEVLMEHRGEIWAKLDAGTADYFRLVDRTPIPFEQILNNIRLVARQHPLVIQSLFVRVDGVGPSEEEIASYVERLSGLLRRGGKLKLIQVYTVARRPAEDYVTSLPCDEVDAIAEQVRDRIPTPVEVYYGS
ncbi:Radical SAM superfamily protein [Planctomycetes bacterium Pan216]|uniref:Radical SAM superfamily protein n=1 Tax=Kolteria novifilia TaxID=2527975 RepID=A0A518B4Y8_9BACT|nr:Radical SAM superfamily protein [Planctomycetes bacterium Pan216]